MNASMTSAMLADVVDSTRELGDRALRSVTGLVDRLGSGAKALSEVGTSTVACSCGRPHACWMPNELPAITSAVCAGAKARVRFLVRNCGLADRQVFVAATGPGAHLAIGSPSTATIGALETGELTAEVTVPDGTAGVELILWVRGCNDHVVPWTITVSDNGCATTHEISIEDCPGTQHYWHDHFAQPRPCRNARHG
jgi:hypothetical protein